jgi:hypothetical protein
VDNGGRIALAHLWSTPPSQRRHLGLFLQSARSCLCRTTVRSRLSTAGGYADGWFIDCMGKLHGIWLIFACEPVRNHTASTKKVRGARRSRDADGLAPHSVESSPVQILPILPRSRTIVVIYPLAVDETDAMLPGHPFTDMTDRSTRWPPAPIKCFAGDVWFKPLAEIPSNDFAIRRRRQPSPPHLARCG